MACNAVAGGLAVASRQRNTSGVPETSKEELLDRACALGFVRAGVARVSSFGREGEALRRWIEHGYHASMAWMASTLEVRLDPTHAGMLPGARSVIVLAAPYGRPSDEAQGPPPSRVARYARGRDYHNVLNKRAQKLAAALREAGHAARVSVDSIPVLERAWAQRAGIGFIGKNCCLIVPGIGSHVFLACVVTDADLAPDEPMAERCGSCTLCLDGCPTRAFVAERQLDSSRCISYLTIEHRGDIDVELRAPIGDRLFGCDECQDVCPFNKKSFEATDANAPFASRKQMDVSAAELLALDDAQFIAWAQGSPLRRARREGIARNAAIVLGNNGERRHLPVLRRAAEQHDSALVREAARWAAARIEEKGD